jgi:twitching motility protein PilT|nr:ATPase, T2SS/T4P/T4SS family [Kofleriaceae bacterium]
MGRIDVYLRSIERFGAAGALLSSGQSVTLKFPTGDRHATQVTPHDQLVALVREVAPPAALDQIDRARPAKFEIDSNGIRYTITVAPRANNWQVGIEPSTAAGSGSSPAPAGTGTHGGQRDGGSNPAAKRPSGSHPQQVAQGRGERRSSAMPATAAPNPSSVVEAMPGPEEDDRDMSIERGQYDGTNAAQTSSGSRLLDWLTSQARQVNASDVYLTAGSPAFMRVGGELAATNDRGPLEAEILSRELGIVAPPEVRTQWLEKGTGVFVYGDGTGRVRVTLTRDHRGPGAALRLLVGEAPTLEQLSLDEVDHWLDDNGLILVSGPSGSGKTTTLAAVIRALGERRRRVVTVEDPIEIVHVSPWISQRAVKDHVPGIIQGVEAAMAEGADAIVVGRVDTPEAARAVIDAAAGGHLVLTTVVSPAAQVAAERLIARLPGEQREEARVLVGGVLLGTVGLILGRNAERSFEVTFGMRQPGQ